jgi:hypothetical protein
MHNKYKVKTSSLHHTFSDCSSIPPLEALLDEYAAAKKHFMIWSFHGD